MRVLLIGATGLLGRALTRHCAHLELISASSSDTDIRSPDQVDALLQRSAPEVVIHAAAFTNVDGCESDPDLAFSVNHRGTINVAKAARKSCAQLFFVSSDYVFDGMKRSPYDISDPRNPINVYGRSKARAEEDVFRILPEACIVRTSWLFGAEGRCFPRSILKAASAGQELRVVDDQRGSPTWNHDLAAAIVSIIDRGARGIVHITNSGACTWYEFAEEVLRQAHLETVPLTRTTTAAAGRLADRPRYSVLSTKSLLTYGLTLPPWRDAVRRYMTDGGLEFQSCHSVGSTS